MLNIFDCRSRQRSQAGFTLIEVLVTLLVLALGLLGLANLQAKMHLTEVEAYQRAQATLLLRDIGGRLRAAGDTGAANYVTGTSAPLGTGVVDDDCTTLTGADQDLCEWSGALKGSAETKAGAQVGALLGGRGCVEQIQASDSTAGVCKAGIYRVTVAWQGLNKTVAPSLACGQGDYGDDALRRAIATTITIGLPKCI